jgi:glycosyl transferase family 25
VIYPWARAVVINLPSRPERLESFTLGAAKHKIDFDVWQAIEHPFGAIGCLQSHQAILREFKESGDESWAIFEDDCLFVGDFEQRFHQFFDAVPVSWDALWLGGKHAERPTTMHEHASIITDVRLSHAYVLSYRPVDALLSLSAEGLPGTSHVDKMWSDLLSKRALTYSPTPWLCGQASGYSDITKTNLKERWG